jgi:ribosomal protein L29
MKRKDLHTLRQMNKTELVKAIVETKAKLAETLINRYSKQSKNVRETRGLKRKIAVASTILQEKELVHE